MISAPRLATRGMNSSAIQASSSTASQALSPSTLALTRSGYWVVEWLPQTVMLVTAVTGWPSLLASWAIARLWSRRVIAVKRSRGTSGAFDIAIRQLVLAGLPTTSTLTSSAAPAAIASPCGLKMPPLASSRSERSMPGPRGRAPTSRPTLQPSKACLGIVVDVDLAQQREGAVVQLHRGALGRLDGVGDLQQAQLDRGVGAEHLAAGDPEQKRVADLAGGAGDGDLDGVAHGIGISWNSWVGDLRHRLLEVLVDRGQELLCGLELLA